MASVARVPDRVAGPLVATVAEVLAVAVAVVEPEAAVVKAFAAWEASKYRRGGCGGCGGCGGERPLPYGAFRLLIDR